MTHLSAFLAALFTALLGALAVLQLLLLVGMPLGRLAWGGQQDRLTPRLRVAAGFSILIYVVFAATALARAQVITTPIPNPINVIAMWIITGYLILSVLPNLASKSPHERRLMTFVSAVLAILALAIALI
ncbi:MAG: hypothetical protein LH475_00300 [Cryobacterium sp.]|uniref:hypothetical protein n=1 Tax=unclassified Cryobacterium TaxID=2649013 RepID=UPI0018CAE33F|nr:MULTISPECIES: hypothetical protein [unclassified Cryobacterium]MCY7403079.1 hypothetical protein [Cryobacterium sp.]MEC5155702.1 hypothetical protein [Cryobacterium sp. CAN_C3]